MSSNKMAFGAAGAVSNTKHPVLIAKHLATRFQNEDNFHLVPPQVIVGSGADALAIELGIPIVANDELKSPQAVQMYEIARSRLLALEEASTEAEDPPIEPSDVPMDTVGCAYVSDTGPAEATVSSGGMLLKADGRLGHSTQFGSAIWAEQRGRRSIAISVSGCGEVLTRTHFAQALAEAVFKASEDDMLPSAITSFYHKFIDSPTIAAFPAHRRVVGGILIFKLGRTCELAAFHNNARFAFAFHNGKSVKHFISELNANAPFVCNSFVVNL
uniref:Asparaginase n=1 Tax=Panagrellus redivivus TaxID=6233 RepID=A0A7E4V1H2_PANRE